MSINQDINKKETLSKVKLLKDYFGIGSQEAFTYVKIRESFGQLRDSVATEEVIRGIRDNARSKFYVLVERFCFKNY